MLSPASSLQFLTPQMKLTLARLTVLLLAPLAALHAGDSISLTEHVRSASDLGELRDLRAEWNNGVLKISTSKAEHNAWAVIPGPKGGWDLARRATVNAGIINTGDEPVGVMLWVVGNHGWSAVVDAATLAPHERRTFRATCASLIPMARQSSIPAM